MPGLGGHQRPRHPVPASFLATRENRRVKVQIVVGTVLLQQPGQQIVFCSK